ncbi:hypothetical protein DY000_02028915 [Brassica cretica]|uniref:Uncharacterized protein n=1 Tax=Brassica cretica TaxID=69181 RepID=A0ABQ7DVR2_BRACR|nr:hypothetical protein DY000_02028915 [Brassica cretica]
MTIAGMGFFTDAYDLFCVSLVTKLLGRLYYFNPLSEKPGSLPPPCCGGGQRCGPLWNPCWSAFLWMAGQGCHDHPLLLQKKNHGEDDQVSETCLRTPPLNSSPPPPPRRSLPPPRRSSPPPLPSIPAHTSPPLRSPLKCLMSEARDLIRQMSEASQMSLFTTTKLKKVEEAEEACWWWSQGRQWCLSVMVLMTW